MRKWVLVLFVSLFLPSTIFAASLDQVNQKVCDRFEEDLAKMAGIMEEVRRRKGILETRVAYEGVDTPIEMADYWIVYAYDAVAFARVQKFSSKNQLRNSLEVLKNKTLKAKNEIRKV